MVGEKPNDGRGRDGVSIEGTGKGLKGSGSANSTRLGTAGITFSFAAGGGELFRFFLALRSVTTSSISIDSSSGSFSVSLVGCPCFFAGASHCFTPDSLSYGESILPFDASSLAAAPRFGVLVDDRSWTFRGDSNLDGVEGRAGASDGMS